MKNLTVYRFANGLFFSNEETKEEGTIVLGQANRGNDVYKYVSHLEDCEDIDEERQNDIVNYLEDNFDLITNAKEL